MILSICYTALAVTIFLIKGNKRIFPLLLPTCFLAGIIDLWTDVACSVYSLWKYSDYTPLIHVTRHFIHPFGAYFFTTYLFLQWLPRDNTIKKMFIYITGWVCFTTLVELTFVHFGELKYGKHWGPFHSILADYALFFIFYFHNAWFQRKITNYFR